MSELVPFRSRREARWEYSGEAIDAIEEWNCSHGCAIPPAAEVEEFGPGGNCPLLVTVSIGDDEPIDGLFDDGERVLCADRKSITVGRHNHFTRDVRPFGECPACDRIHMAARAT